MIGLFDRDWRTSYALADIASVTASDEHDSGKRTYRVMLKDGSASLDIMAHAYSRIVAHPIQLMPAQPGIEALSVFFQEGERHLNKTPVIAWALCFDGSIRIVTPQGVDDGHMWDEGQGYVLMPDGRVESVREYLDYTCFSTLDEYLEHESGQQREREARA